MIRHTLIFLIFCACLCGSGCKGSIERDQRQTLNKLNKTNAKLEKRLKKANAEAQEMQACIDLAADNERHRYKLIQACETLESKLTNAQERIATYEKKTQHFNNMLTAVNPNQWSTQAANLGKEELKEFTSAELTLKKSLGELVIASKLINPAVAAKLNIGSALSVVATDLSIDFSSKLATIHFPKSKEMKTALELATEKNCNIEILLNSSTLVISFEMADEKAWFNKDIEFQIVSLELRETE